MSDDNVIPIRPPKIIAMAGGPIDETRVTLDIHGDDLDPKEISELLRCGPTAAHRRGDPRPRGLNPWPSGAWLLSVGAKAPTEPEELLDALLSKLPADGAVWTGLHQRFTVRLGFGLFLDAWNRGFELSPKTLQRVAKIGVPLGFDIYAEWLEDDG